MSLSNGVNLPIDGTGLTFTAGQTYTYTIATLNNSNFTIGTVNFPPTNVSQLGIAPASSFSLVTSGSNLNLQFTPVPEPAFVLTVGLCVAAGGTWLRRRVRGGP